MTSSTAIRDFYSKLFALRQGYTPPANPEIIERKDCPIGSTTRPLVAYRSPGGVFCAYARQEDEQAAFNAVFHAIPMDDSWKTLGAVDWTFLGFPARDCPEGHFAYVGASAKKGR